MDFCAFFFLCVLGCFFGSEVELVAGHAQKRMEKYRKGPKKLAKFCSNELIQI
jgi:hypothetical protein